MSRHLSLDAHSLLVINDSDEPEVYEDFVSFPTLPDPDTVANRSISTIITKTLRKVTNNASNLVHAYASPRHQNEAHPDIIDTLSIYSFTRTPQRAFSTNSDTALVDLEDTHNSQHTSQHNSQHIAQHSAPTPDFVSAGPSRTSTVLSQTAASPPSVRGVLQVNSLVPDQPTETLQATSSNKLQPTVLNTSLPSIASSQAIINPKRVARPESSGLVSSKLMLKDERTPKVISDNRFLRISTLQNTKLPALLVSKNEVMIVSTDLALTPLEAGSLTESAELDSTKVRLRKSSTLSSADGQATLQKRISSIFNNLPNDIEVSDDSASDLETINNDSMNSITNLHSPNGRSRLGSIKLSSKYTASPTRANSTKVTRMAESPTVSTFGSIRGAHRMTRKISSNFPSAFIDGARSIINTNLSGVASSTSTMVESITEGPSRRKKIKKRHQLSDNPLKNGGIPKKYWMNDSFVSECLNCFKPFTAFRRKHHCRFCGQIFCADCTMFISYSQYKQQRRGDDKDKETKSYTDKLRVCKPCYSDVIVYLSDDSLSSSDEEEMHILRHSAASSDNDEAILPDHLLARFKSHSTNSRRNSLASDSPLLNPNKAFLNRNVRESPEALTSTAEASQRSPEAILYKHAPQMAIPTTRAGEAVEIQIPVQKPQFNSLPLKSNLAILAMKNAVNSNSHGNGNNGNDSFDGSWYNHFNQNQPHSAEIAPSSSLDNLGQLYKAVVNSRYGRLASNSDNRGFIQAERSEPEDDVESENEDEDEQVMSLYTSLNHNSASQTALSPRAHISLTSSMATVPTLHEFPTMVIDDKYIPADFNHNGGLQRFEFRPMDSFHNASMNENKLRSDYRSNERAKASLRRIRYRRTNRLGRKSSLAVPLLHPVETNIPNAFGSNSSPLSTPNSPTPKSQPGYFYPSSLPKRSNSNPAHPMGEDAPQTEPSTPQTKDDVGEVTQVLHYSLEDHNKEHQRSFITDMDLNEYFKLFEPSIDRHFDEHIRKLIGQCLEDCDINDPSEKSRWLKILHLTLLNINQIKIGDTLDIKQYVKIKKIFGGKIEETNIVDGLFITKNIDSKRMRSQIENPKIALLMFPIEYLKQKEQFISLRIVNSQQAVYISNLVSRLVSLEPDIIVVGDTVCGLAEQLLEDANITVISNMKPQVIERISRYTKGDIFQSVNDLFFKKGRLGTCGQFEVKRYLYKDTVKTYSFFTGSTIESGFTICLRGGDEELLGSTKYAAESVVPGVFNARFEKSFFKDVSLIIEASALDIASTRLNDFQMIMKQDEEGADEAKLSCVLSISHYGIADYIALFQKRILSDSPAVQFTLPKSLDKLVDAFLKYADFCDFNDSIQKLQPTDEVDHQWLERLNFDFNLERLGGKENIIEIVKFVSADQSRRLLNEVSHRTRLWSNSMKYPIYQLYPIFHKSIHFLHSTVSIKHATPCSGPIVVVIDYYTDNDKCLGMFLDQILQESNKVCDECGESMLDHYKTYAHDNGKIDLIVERVEKSDSDMKKMDQRIMWSYCPECNISTPITVISDETYYLSLGKFLELNFWGQNVSYFKDCPHDYFRKHVKYFGVNDLVIRMEYSPIDTYEVVVPSKKLEFILETDIKLKIESLEQIKNSSHLFFLSISQRLNRVKVDTFDKAEAGRQRVEELKARLNDQQKFISAKTMSIYSTTPPTNYLSLNVVQRDLQELGVAWDKEFNEFESDFLPTENEITKITQFHLRNFLMDKLDTDLKDSDEGQKDVKETGALSANGSNAGSSLSPDLSQQKINPEARDFLNFGSRMRVPLSIIEDKILQFQQSLENDQKLVLKSPVKSRSNSIVGDNSSEHSAQQTPNRVQDLTNYFNQMTLEFQRQREEVLEKKSNNYKAIPIANSKPIVEMYDNIEDVVDVNPKHLKSNENQSSEVSNGITDRKQELVQLQEQRKNLAGDGQAPKTGGVGAGKQKLEIPQPERNSLLKTLTNFWADRSATLWDPLQYPLDITEHTFADSDVIVREDEPSSLVAFCLSTADYKQKIINMGTNPEESNDNLEINEQYIKKLDNFTNIERKFKKRFAKSDNGMSELEAIMTKTKSTHLKYQFLDGCTDLSCKIFYSEQFEAFRKACGVNDSFVQSLSRCVKWNSKGGKSGSNFLKTLDNKYILKELSKSELESFVSIAPFYFKYISQSTFNTLTTAIAKIFGFYQVEIRNTSNGKTFKMDFLIMENLFYNRNTTRIFDLKGSMRNRHVKQTGKENEVLLDENMIEYIYESPVFVKEHYKKLLRGSLFNDTSFLSAMDVMDYSLVIGFDDTSHKLYVGIIDWLRTFTWDKKVENWMKGNSLVGKKGKDPTIVTPKQYRTRFREAMDRYILEVPDIWYEGN